MNQEMILDCVQLDLGLDPGQIEWNHYYCYEILWWKGRMFHHNHRVDIS